MSCYTWFLRHFCVTDPQMLVVICPCYLQIWLRTQIWLLTHGLIYSYQISTAEYLWILDCLSDKTCLFFYTSLGNCHGNWELPSTFGRSNSIISLIEKTIVTLIVHGNNQLVIHFRIIISNHMYMTGWVCINQKYYYIIWPILWCRHWNVSITIKRIVINVPKIHRPNFEKIIKQSF